MIAYRKPAEEKGMANKVFVLDAGVFLIQGASGLLARATKRLATTSLVVGELLSDKSRLALEIIGKKLQIINQVTKACRKLELLQAPLEN